MKIIRYERVAPRAATLIESMRDIGYSLQTALADIIDNSITANADLIEILAETKNQELYIAIIDNGNGMSSSELMEAMRPGTRSPLDKRDSLDLGRFGLGLKTASFSQCRRLTVVSRKNAETNCARWDLDEVVKTDDWLIEIPDEFFDIPSIERLGDQGTLVLWEKIDRLTEHTNQIRQLDEAAEHLMMVFHRFIEGEKGLKKITLSLNERKLGALNPFNLNHPATQIGPLETIRLNGHDITVQSFTLPHHKKVSSSDWERYAGREGYVKNQGFYVYRGKRLIIHGTWFGLARQMELTKLARVQIDIPNEMDSDWKIDVRKASAQLPPQVRERLRRIIETIGAASKRIYTARGQKLAGDSRLPVWNRRQDKNEINYVLNFEHPVFTDFSDRLSDGMQSEFRKILEMASATIPIDSLFADVSGNPEAVTNAKMSDKSFFEIIETTFNTLRHGGLSSMDIRDMLSVSEPFRSRWSETAMKLDKLIKGSDN